MIRPLEPPDGPNWFTRRNAYILAKRIERYWKDRGYDGILTRVVCDPVGRGVKDFERHAIWCVRSNIVNGFPPREAAAIRLVA